MLLINLRKERMALSLFTSGYHVTIKIIKEMDISQVGTFSCMAVEIQ